MKSYRALEKSLSMSDAQGGQGGSPLQPDHEECSGHEDRSDHGSNDAHDECDSEPLDRSGAELKKEERGEHRADVGVDDGIHRVFEALIDCQANGLAME